MSDLKGFLNTFPELTVITQYNKNNKDIWENLYNEGHKNHVVLFDSSGGNGILPSEWPEPLPIHCGYAGGLGKDNLDTELNKIFDVVKDRLVWIDMEGKLRTVIGDEDLFDINKCMDCLNIVSNKITYNPPKLNFLMQNKI